MEAWGRDRTGETEMGEGGQEGVGGCGWTNLAVQRPGCLSLGQGSPPRPETGLCMCSQCWSAA